MTTRDPRGDRLEGVLERIASEQTQIRRDISDLRIELRAELRTWFGTLLAVNVVMWVIVIALLVWVFFTTR
jgi:hypothetical protein